MENTMRRKKVVIIGGGFAGVEATRLLAKSSVPVDIVMVSSNPSFQYYPNLYRLVVGAIINQVSLLLKEILPEKVSLVIDTYIGINQTKKTVTLQSGTELSYDFIVLAMGSQPNYFGIAGLEEQAKSFLSTDKALALKKYFTDLLQESKKLSDTEAAIQLRTIVVGAGPAGVEFAAALRPYLLQQAKQYGIKDSLITIDLLDSSSRVLPALPLNASALVEKQLQKNGVTFYANHCVNTYKNHVLNVTDKTNGAEMVKEFSVGTVIWTAGTKISTDFTSIPNITLTDRKRVQVSPTLTLPNDSSVYIAGDGSGTPFSGLAQTAVDQGQYVARAIIHQIQNKGVAPYEPKQGIFVIPVGKRWAIFNYKNFVISGYVAYVIRILADLQYFLSISSIKHIFKMLRKA